MRDRAAGVFKLREVGKQLGKVLALQGAKKTDVKMGAFVQELVGHLWFSVMAGLGEAD